MITGLHSICDKSTLKIFIVMICECLKIKNIDDDTQYRKLYCYNFCIIGNGKKPCLSVKGCQKSYLDIKLAPPRIVKWFWTTIIFLKTANVYGEFIIEYSVSLIHINCISHVVNAIHSLKRKISKVCLLS